MKYLNLDPSTRGAEDAEDILVATEWLEQKRVELSEQLADWSVETPQRANLLLDYATTSLELKKSFDAWQAAQQAFQIFVAAEDWEGAVQACHLMLGAEQPESLVALGHGVWLAVTFPIDPELSVMLLEDIVNETPDDSDGGAVAATTAHYLVDLRAQGPKRDDLLFFTNQLLAQVARRHSQIETQSEFEAWVTQLELDSPDDFLGRLAQVINVMVQENWWIDREVLRARLPQ